MAIALVIPRVRTEMSGEDGRGAHLPAAVNIALDMVGPRVQQCARDPLLIISFVRPEAQTMSSWVYLLRVPSLHTYTYTYMATVYH